MDLNAYYGEFVQLERLKMNSQFGANRTVGFAADERSQSQRRRLKRCCYRWWLGLSRSPPCCNRSRAHLSEKVADGDQLVAMRARSSRSKPSAKDAALVAALLTEQACLARRALVDDGRLWETAGKAELELVGWSLTQTKTALAAGVRAIGFAASRREEAPAGGAHTLLFERRAIVTQRGFPQVAAVVGASTRR